MEIGVIFPQTEIEPDVAAVRDFAQAAQDMGYSYFFIADHVLGADAAAYDHPLFGMYNHETVVHESLTTMGYLAAVTPEMGLMSGILILPQRQTALVAKQAAEIDVLCGGKLRLGIGVGWNFVEYEALGMNFEDRGARSAEQIEACDNSGRRSRLTSRASGTLTHAASSPAGARPMPSAGRAVPWPHPARCGPAPRGSACELVVPTFARTSPATHCRKRCTNYMAEYGRDPAELGLDDGWDRSSRGGLGEKVEAGERWVPRTCPSKTGGQGSRLPMTT